ncbi:MAG: hypothetical protein ACFFB5_00725 [Promethearchaeota archaeon]
MPTIAYFISDHGLGHATRSIAIIRSMFECDLETSVNIHTSKPLSLMKNSLSLIDVPKRVDFHEQLNDFGFIGDELTGKIDHPKTALEVTSWIQTWHSSYIFDEYTYLKAKNVDLIISDIAPQPFLLAKKLKIPSIAISNFTWLDIYQNSAFNLVDLDTIWKAYREASLGLMLPFNLENTVFRSKLETALVSRKPTRSKEEMRESLGFDSSLCIIYAGTGTSLENPFLREWTEKKDLIFILGGQPNITGHNTRTIPPQDPEGQDYINCSDLALIKVSYSSVSEAIRSHVPIIGVDFVQSAETIFMKDIIKNLGIGVCISPEEYFQGKWIEFIPSVLKMKQNYVNLPTRFTKHGEDQIVNIILDLLEEIT